MLDIIGTVALTLAGIGLFSHHQRVKGRLQAESARYSDLYTKLLLSEELRVRAQTELDFLKQSVIQMVQRPVQAILDDTQVAMITKALNEYWTNVYHKN